MDKLRRLFADSISSRRINITAVLLVGACSIISLQSLAQKNLANKPSGSVTQPVRDGEEPPSISGLLPYPSNHSSASEDLASNRNPFSQPTALGMSQVSQAPFISIKGFSGNTQNSSIAVFLKINQSSDEVYRIGQEVGNGYRIVSIQPEVGRVTISNGISRHNYVLKDF